MASVEKELEVPSQLLTFSSDGWEALKPRSITEDELWQKLATAVPRARGNWGMLSVSTRYPSLPLSQKESLLMIGGQNVLRRGM